MSSGPAHGARRAGARAPGAVAPAGALVLAASMVALGLSLRDLLDAGGACATGGPFAIENPCPDGVDLLLPLAGLTGFAGAVALAYGLDRVPGGGPAPPGAGLLAGAAVGPAVYAAVV